MHLRNAYHQRTSVPPAYSVDDFEQLGSVQQEKEKAENRTPSERRNLVDRWMIPDPYIAPARCGPVSTLEPPDSYRTRVRQVCGKSQEVWD